MPRFGCRPQNHNQTKSTELLGTTTSQSEINGVETTTPLAVNILPLVHLVEGTEAQKLSVFDNESKLAQNSSDLNKVELKIDEIKPSLDPVDPASTPTPPIPPSPPSPSSPSVINVANVTEIPTQGAVDVEKEKVKKNKESVIIVENGKVVNDITAFVTQSQPQRQPQLQSAQQFDSFAHHIFPLPPPNLLKRARAQQPFASFVGFTDQDVEHKPLLSKHHEETGPNQNQAEPLGVLM